MKYALLLFSCLYCTTPYAFAEEAPHVQYYDNVLQQIQVAEPQEYILASISTIAHQEYIIQIPPGTRFVHGTMRSTTDIYDLHEGDKYPNAISFYTSKPGTVSFVIQATRNTVLP